MVFALTRLLKFKDVAAAIRKREEARSSSKKGKKAPPPTPDPPTTPKASTAKKRPKESEETPKTKEKSRHKDHKERSPSQEKTRKSSKDTHPPSKKKSKKEKIERSPAREDKDSNDSKFSLSTLSKQGKSSPNDENEEKPKEEDLKQEEHDASMENNNVESVLPQDDERDKENMQSKNEETSKRKRKRSASSSSSCSSASSSRHRSSDDSDSEQNAHVKSTAKKKAHSERTKMDKLKFTMKSCKEIAESVEAALFKVCESNLNSPKYKGWTKTFIQNVTDCRNKGFYHRVLTGDLSVQKLVTLEAEDMRKPEYSSPLNGEGSEEAIKTESVGTVSPATATTNAAKTEENSENAAQTTVKSEEGGAAVSSTPEPGARKKSTSKKESPAKTPLNDKKKLDAKLTRQSSRKSDGQKLAAASALDSILGDGAKDTTEQHLSHFYDVNCNVAGESTPRLYT
ncbi:transcription factor S-II, central domain protein [Oesophagostomum dentatum]|uniref:Transcription factor S-II, central domain protein n=1 Tax=Oesophagostomum dentatum TaxID=61180 RepID=A0A0B1T011_OESDE|nr:transcription factor S-II, central domain protein [Oesophagostomum dentatum]